MTRPARPNAVWLESRRHGQRGRLPMVGCFGLRLPGVPDRPRFLRRTCFLEVATVRIDERSHGFNRQPRSDWTGYAGALAG